MERRIRSLAKTLSYRAISIAVTFLVSLALTGSLQLSASIGLLDGIIKFFPFYVHERTWSKISWGSSARRIR